MKVILSIILISICLDCQAMFETSDSSRNGLSFEFGKRKMYCHDFIHETQGPFTNNTIYSAAVQYKRLFYELKKYQLSLEFGLNYRLYSCDDYSDINTNGSNISIKTGVLGIQNGLSISRTLIQSKSIKMDLECGIFSTGMILSKKRNSSFIVQNVSNSTHDSISLTVNRNRNFYINQFVNLGFSKRNSRFKFGLKFISSSSIAETEITYTVFKANFIDVKYDGHFGDYRMMLEPYFEYKF